MLEFTGLCAGCDQWTTLDDVGLCETCAAKFDRGLIRQRAYDPKDYEALRQAIIEQYGPTCELLDPPERQSRLLLTKRAGKWRRCDRRPPS